MKVFPEHPHKLEGIIPHKKSSRKIPSYFYIKK